MIEKVSENKQIQAADFWQDIPLTKAEILIKVELYIRSGSAFV